MTNRMKTMMRELGKNAFLPAVFLAFGLALAFAASCSVTGRLNSLPGAHLIAGADYVGRATCAGCHPERAERFGRTLHDKIKIPASEQQGLDLVCESCHGPGGLHLEAGGGRGAYIVVPSEDPEACFQCHPVIRGRFYLKFHHPLGGGKLNCTNCHDPHGREIFASAGAKGPTDRQVCGQCHQDKTGPHVFEHEALREGCPFCHEPHGSINEKQLVERGLNLCLRCHGQIAAQGAVVMGDFAHTTRVAQGVCWSVGCHTAVHGSNINPHLRY